MENDFWDFLDGGRSYLEMMLDARKFKEKTIKSNKNFAVYSFWFDDKICKCQKVVEYPFGVFWKIVVRYRTPYRAYNYNTKYIPVAEFNKDSFCSVFESLTGKPLRF